MSISLRLNSVLAGLVVGIGVLLASSGGASAQAAVKVPVGDIWFCSEAYSDSVCTTETSAGDTVVWDFSGVDLPHSATACGSSCDSPTGSPLWDSGIISDGSSYQYRFENPGTYLYYCVVHPYQRGQIVVTAAAQEPTDGPVDDGTVSPDGTAEPQTIVVPVVGTGPSSGGSSVGWIVAASAAIGTALMAGGVALARARR